MSTDSNNPSKRGKALHDATQGQFGEEPRAKPMPEKPEEGDLKGGQSKAAREKSCRA
ncbi:MAG: hypothetical protein ACREAY_01950 [Nitrososphaera sp.]|uniref:hypothetical protein n=1 Tax=Nitrososphaera sp. TaxID=1971748 RepID=UPI003D6EBAE7